MTDAALRTDARLRDFPQRMHRNSPKNTCMHTPGYVTLTMKRGEEPPHDVQGLLPSRKTPGQALRDRRTLRGL